MVNRKASALAVASAAALVTGCGSSSHFANKPSPPALLIISAAVSDGKVVLSPAHVGAGPIQLVVANETGASQQVTLTSAQPGVLQEQTAPINPGSTARLKADLGSGSYSVSVDGSNIRSGTIDVGAERSTAQNQLLQP